METIVTPAAKPATTKEGAAQPKAKRPFPEKGTLVIRAYDSKRQHPVICRPCEDETGRVFTGQGPTGHFETLSEEDKRKLSYLITPHTAVALLDGKVVRLGDEEKGIPGDPVDVANWPWLRKHPYLALTKELGYSSKDAVYYIEDAVSEAEQRVSKSKDRDRARYLIQYEMNIDKLKRTAMILGHIGTDSMTPTQLQDWLLQQADVIPTLVLDAINPTDEKRAQAKIALMELMKRRIIQRGEAGLFRFGGEKGVPLGHTEDLVLDFMLDEKNSDTVSMMKTALVENKGTSK